MRSLQFMFYNSSLVLKEVPKLTLNKAKAVKTHPKYLVKVHFSPINPSDMGFIAGVYGRYQDNIFPKTAGFEGSGVIVDTDSAEKEDLIGKKVSFWSNYEKPHFSGAWTDYTIVDDSEKFILPDHFELKDSCCLLVNPLTALSFLEICKQNNTKAVIHTAGGSALGKMLIKVFKEHDIDIINTVRRERIMDEIRSIGAKYVTLSSNIDDFKIELKKLSEMLKPTIAFECIGGEMTGIVLNNLKEGGSLYHYGNLSLKSISNILTRDLLFEDKTMKGFWVSGFLNSLNQEKREYIYRQLIDYKTRTKYFDVNYEIYNPNDVQIAIKNYRSEMGVRKIILDFSK